MSSFLDRIKASMNGSFNKPIFNAAEKKEKSRQSIVTNRWDQRVWETARKTEVIDSLISDLSNGNKHTGGEREPFDAAPELVRDLFMAFYKAAPTLEKKGNLDPEVLPVYPIIKEMVDNPRLQELQDVTASDPAMSTIGVKAVKDTVIEIITRMPPPPPPPQPKGPGGGKGKPGEDDEPPQEGEGEGPGEGAGGNGGEPETEWEDQEGGPESDWMKDFEKMMEENDIDLERAMNKALDKAEDDVNDLEELRQGFGIGDGEWAQMSPEERLKMAARLSTPEMKALSEVLGRMRRFALGIKASRINDVPHEAYDVETGDNLQHVLKSEYALLATPETSYEFFRKYSEQELLQYKLRGREEVGKGPIVVCIDKSGSMSGDPFHWAMGVAEALRRFAADEERDYYAFFFGSNNDRNRFEFPEGKGPFEKVMAFLSVAANGGTQFDGVLTEALQKASETFDDQGKAKADIVFITDGESYLDDDWIEKFNAERERAGVSVFSVYIGGGYDMRYSEGPLALLGKISDVTIPVKDLRPESAKEIFAKV